MRKIVSRFMLLVISALFIFSSNIFAGEGPSGNETAGLDKLTSEWQLDQEVNGIQVYLKRTECNDVMNGIFQEFVLVKLVNITEVDMTATWDMELWFDGNCWTCDMKNDSEYRYVVNLPAGEVKEGECGTESIRELQIFLKFLNYDDKPELTKYNFANFQVNPR